MNTRVIARLTAADRRRAERRRARRVAPGQLTPCVIRPAGAAEDLPGWVHNLSVHGAGLLCPQPFGPGELLNVLFINAAHTFALSVEVQVARIYRVVNGDYFLGTEFGLPLRYDELLPFMG